MYNIEMQSRLNDGTPAWGVVVRGVQIMNHVEYEGWYNYETWAVKLWLDNDQDLYEYWRERTQEIIADAPEDENVPKIWTADEAARFTLANELKEWHEREAPLNDASVWTDLLRAALSEVNWPEIADALIETEKESA